MDVVAYILIGIIAIAFVGALIATLVEAIVVGRKKNGKKDRRD